MRWFWSLVFLHSLRRVGPIPRRWAIPSSMPCSGRPPDVLARLLKAGAGVSGRDDDGQTPLLRAAAFSGDPEVIAALLKAGARINAANKCGRTLLMYAAGFNRFNHRHPSEPMSVYRRSRSCHECRIKKEQRKRHIDAR